MSALFAKGFVLALAIAATAIIGGFALAGGEVDQQPAGGRWRRFVERMRALGLEYVGRDRFR